MVQIISENLKNNKKCFKIETIWVFSHFQIPQSKQNCITDPMYKYLAKLVKTAIA